MADFEVLIIGAGFSGLCMSIKLLQAGYSSFVMLEKHSDIGGTWFLNRYPGCRCDIPSHLYSYSFARNPSWTSVYADRSEIHRYIKDCAAHHGVLPHVRFNTVAVSTVWDANAAFWRVDVEETIPKSAPSDVDHQPPIVVTSTISARFVVRAVGAFHVPNYPVIKGMEKFAGPAFHSSFWNNSISVEGKTVAVIGNGASGIQIVPGIAPTAKKVYALQRTPAWVLPKPPNWGIPKRCRQLLEVFPALMCMVYWLIFLVHEVVIWGVVGGKVIRRVAEWVVRRNMRGAIKDAEMLEKLEPKYEMGCKRILLSNDFYPALVRPNVELITDPIVEIRENSLLVRANGQNMRSVPVDVIIYATGFQLVSKLRVIGTLGLEFSQAGYSSLLGITKHGFPNYFMLFGFNTGVAQTSQILTIEAQARYVVSCLNLVRGSTRSIEPRDSSQRRHQDYLARRFPKMVWSSGGCNSWYIDPTTRHNFTMWPASTLEYIYRTWSANPSDFHMQ